MTCGAESHRIASGCSLRAARLRPAQPPLAAAFLAERRIHPSARRDVLRRRTSRSAAGVAFDLRRCVRLRPLHVSPAAVETGHPLETDTGRPIAREAREGPPARASYLSARSRRRFRMNGSAFLARWRAPSACLPNNSLSIGTPPQARQESQ